MWYLNRELSDKLHALSVALIAENGWMDQFAITNKVLLQLHIELGQLNLGQPRMARLYQEIVDALIVMQHPINHLGITDAELQEIGFNKYMVGDTEKEAKIPRTYRRVLGIESYTPTGNLHDELDKMATLVIAQQQKKRGDDKGVRFQIYRTMEELLELATELSIHVRIFDTRGSTDHIERAISDNRTRILDEVFDVLYTLRYIMYPLDITTEMLNKMADERIQYVYEHKLKRTGTNG